MERAIERERLKIVEFGVVVRNLLTRCSIE